MHKCPPAEACRDAFERMSKATVQMCLSTTGFGSQVDMTRVHAASSEGAGPLHTGRVRPPMDRRQRAGQGQARQTAQTRSTRPAPRFDMNLADLFNDNTPLADPNPTENRPGGQSFPVRPDQPDQMPHGFAGDSSSRPFPQRTQSMEYYMKYEAAGSPQPHAQLYYGHSPQQGGSPGSLAQAQISGTPHGLPQSDAEVLPGISLDFLDFSSGDRDRDNPSDMAVDPSAEYGLTAMPSLGHNLGQNVGIDLGFGMAMDFQHDWSENPNYDLLEGYFFGGSGPGAPGGDA